MQLISYPKMLLALQFFGWNRSMFQLDDYEIKLYGGAIDLIRIPYQYWEQRVDAAQAMGLNTIAVQLNWNAIEVNSTYFDFVSEQNNLRNFLLICRKHQMMVVLRPGPQSHYFTSAGGLPMRMHYDEVSVRDYNDEVWSEGVHNYIEALAAVIGEFTEEISMIQLEQLTTLDRVPIGYTNWLRQIYIKNGIYGPFLQLESSTSTTGLEGTALGLSGTPTEYALKMLGEAWPNAPVFYGNLFTGDPTYYFSDTPQARQIRLEQLIGTGQNFILMFFTGGTNFGLEASGVVIATYAAYTTSNDFGAPLSENGYPTSTYNLYQYILTDIPIKIQVYPLQTIKPFNLVKTGSVKGQNFIDKGTFNKLPTFENLRQRQGLGLYEFTVEANKEGILAIERVKDYAMVYVDDVLVHIFDRSETTSFNQVINSGSGNIKIVVDTNGHHGHSGDLFDDKKGIYGKILFDNKAPTEFKVSLLSIEDFKPQNNMAPGFDGGLYRGEFNTKSASDTYLELLNFKRGYVFVNGYNLGRYWNVDENSAKNLYSRLYCPGVYLNNGVNEVIVFDVSSNDTLVQIGGYQQAFRCPSGYEEVGRECIKE